MNEGGNSPNRHGLQAALGTLIRAYGLLVTPPGGARAFPPPGMRRFVRKLAVASPIVRGMLILSRPVVGIGIRCALAVFRRSGPAFRLLATLRIIIFHPHVWSATILLAEGKADGALASLERAAKRGRLPLAASLMWVELLLQKGDIVQAGVKLNQLVADYPFDQPLVCKAIRTNLDAGEAQVALDIVARFVSCAPTAFDALLEFAHWFRMAGHFKISIKIYKKIRRLAALHPHMITGQEAILAAAAEYGGYSHDAERWTSAWETSLEDRCDKEGLTSFHPIDLQTVTGSIGDMASRMSGLLMLQELGLMPARRSKLLCRPGAEYANSALTSIVARHLEVDVNPTSYEDHAERIPWYAWRGYLNFRLSDGRVVHNTLGCALAEVEWQKQGRAPIFALTPEQVDALGAQVREATGMGAGDWFVAVHVRDGGFYNERRVGAENVSSHRSAEFSAYEPAIEWILEQGGWVVRLGDDTAQPSNLRHSRFVDYAHSAWRSPELDLFFISQCRYLLATNSGPMCVAAAFGTVTGITNYVPLSVPPLSPRNLFIPKLLYSREQQRYLTFAEMLNTPFRGANRAHLFDVFSDELGVDIVDNSPEDILEFTRELHRVTGPQGAGEYPYSTKLSEIFTREGCHYIAHIPPSFVDRHPECLEDRVDHSLLARWETITDDDIGGGMSLMDAAVAQYAERHPDAGLLLLRAAVHQGSGGELARFLLAIKDGAATGKPALAAALAEQLRGNPAALIHAVQVLSRCGAPLVAYDLWCQLAQTSPLMDWLTVGHLLREADCLREAITVFAQAAELVKMGGDSTGQEGVLAATCEYAGSPLQAAYWMDKYEERRFLTSRIALAGRPVVVAMGAQASFIGDLAARLDLLYKGVKTGLIRLPSNHYIVDSKQKWANLPYLDLWREKIRLSDAAQEDYVRTSPRELRTELVDIAMDDGGFLHYPTAYSVINQRWEAEGRAPAITLSEKQKREGWRRLEAFGVTSGDWFVALHVRDGGYYNEANDAASAISSHRSATITNYDKAIDFIIGQGGWVVRLGDKSAAPVLPRPGFIDYAHSDIRSPDMDIFLMSQCRYLFGTNSGPMAVCTSFGVPCGITNYVPLAVPACSPSNFVLPKMMWYEPERRFLNLGEMLGAPLGHANRSHLFIRAHEVLGIRLVENSPDELLAFAQELHARTSTQTVNERAPEQSRIRKIFEKAGAHYISRLPNCWIDAYFDSIDDAGSSDLFDLWRQSHKFPSINERGVRWGYVGE